MKRLPGLIWAVVIALGLSACGEGGERSPNVLLVVMDTTRADRCSVNGYERPTTPHLERIAAEGVAYTNAWSPSGWTAPAHASLFTALRPENHGFRRSVRNYLEDDAVTLAEKFRAGGYATACFTNNDNICQETGLAQGFDRLDPLFQIVLREYPWAPETHERAIDFALDSAMKGKPFFLFINDMEPHWPYTPLMEYERRLYPGPQNEAELAAARDMAYEELLRHNAGAQRFSRERLEAVSRLYDAEIACLDHSVGALIEGLREEGLLDDTVVVVTADHGENLGDHGLVDHVFSIHRSIRHVPLVMRYPDRIPAGKRVDDVVRLEDVGPTLLELCNLTPFEHADGRSLLNDLPGRVSLGMVDAPLTYLDKVCPQQVPTADLSPFRASMRAVFDGRYHYILYTDGREELYDVRDGPRELRNRASEYTKEVERLRPLLDGQTAGIGGRVIRSACVRPNGDF